MMKKLAVFVSIVVLAVAVAAATAIVNRKPTLTGRAIVSNSTILIADESEDVYKRQALFRAGTSFLRTYSFLLFLFSEK